MVEEEIKVNEMKAKRDENRRPQQVKPGKKKTVPKKQSKRPEWNFDTDLLEEK